ncbi:MAG: hypothetical protein HYV09_13670 [Deltaproteobacteria bacterium]|nr:hypothetical protein [Deltaproteobacteria bacterium]
MDRRALVSSVLLALALPLGCASGAPSRPPLRTGSPLATAQSPTERYERFRAALATATTLDELLPFTSRAVRDETAKRPEPFKRALLADLRARTVDGLRVTEERVDGRVAKLRVEGVRVVDPARGTRAFGAAKVVLLHEDGAWRVDDEVWTTEGRDESELGPRSW